mgnify:CR=1 FL=1
MSIGLVLITAVLGPASDALAESPPTGPAPSVLPPVAVTGSTAPTPTPSGIASVADATLKKAALGSFSAVVVDPATGTVLHERQALRPRTPASTLKLLTAATALTVLDPQARLVTRVVADDRTITLIGGGDSTLTRTSRPREGLASLSALADAVAAQVQRGPVTLQIDASLFSGPTLGPGWPRSFPRDGVVAPVTALMVDQGRVRPGANARVADPARQAGRVFAAMLRTRGVDVQRIATGTASGGTEIARVESPTIATLVQRMLTDSDDDLAEALAHLSGAKANGSGSFAGGAKAMARVAGDLRLPTGTLEVVDGSGLSGQNAVSTGLLANLLVHVVTQAEPSVSLIGLGLPVAGFTGTLADRFRVGSAQAGAGLVRAKTGTLTGVTSLAGTVVDVDGRMLVFAVLANGVPSIPRARAALDAFSSRLAKCGCR